VSEAAASRTAPPAVAGVAAPGSLARRIAGASIIVLTMGVVAMAVTPASADPDLWGHLRFGLDLIDTGRVDRPDIYSFMTAGVPWVNHEWLAEWLFAVAWRLADGTGLVLLKLAVCLTTFAIVYRHLVWRGLGLFAASIVLLLAIPLTLPWIAVIRPQIFTYLGFVLTLAAIARAEHGAPRALWGLPVVFLLWGNLHGGVLAGLGLLGLWLMARTCAGVATAVWRDAGRWRAERGIWTPAIVAMLATIGNPYAARMWLFFKTALISRLEISEWNPIEVMAIEGAAHMVLLAPIAAGWFWSRREKRPALVLLFLALVALPVLARRNSPLFALGLVMLGGEHLADAASRLLDWLRGAGERGRGASADGVSSVAAYERRSTQARGDEAEDQRRGHAAAATAAAAGGAARPARAGLTAAADAGAFPIPAWAAAVFFAAGIGCAAMALSDLRITFSRVDYPVEAVRLLRASGAQTNLAIPMNWGEYVLWHVGPGIKVSMDGRRETVYTVDGYTEVMDFTFGRDDWDRLLRRPGVDLALVPTAEWPVYNLLKLKPGWTLLHVDDRAALFGRQGSPAAEVIARLPRPPKEGKLLTFP
jgi:hypothetical protein